MTRARTGAPALLALLALGGCGGEPRGACDPAPERGALGTICGFANPEDVEVVAPLGALVVSQMRHADDGPGGALAYLDLDAARPAAGRLWPAGEAPRHAPRGAPDALLDPDCTEPPAAGRFAPHGIAALPVAPGVARLAVVSHAPREAIEVFELRRAAGALRARWIGCAALPPDAVGNDVAWAAPDALVATRYQATRSQPRAALGAIAAGLGFDTGAVLRKRAGEPWRELPGSGGASPNGVAVAPGGAVYFAQTGSGVVTALRDGAATDIAVGGHPDNLAWSESGDLLVATHTDGLAFVACALGRRPCRTGWAAYAIDPRTDRVAPLLAVDGSALGAVASVAQYRGRYFFGSVFDDRIGVWTPARAGAADAADP